MARTKNTNNEYTLNKRRAGVLLHPTSFPSPFGIGDLGKEAYDTLKMLSDAKVSLWQILPLGPTGYGDSPYSARSTFAGNEFLIDLRSLDVGKTYVDNYSDRTARVNYSEVFNSKMTYLKEAAQLFLDGPSSKTDYESFCKTNAWWLKDYALYQALVNHFNESRWYMWEEDLKTRKTSALNKWTKTLSKEIEVYKVLQYFFFTQWDKLHKYANSLGIQIIGDIPIYVAGDSVDAWTNWKLFKIDDNGNQTALAGCPPDYFSQYGQLWGNPVYNWPEHQKDNYAWWRKRMEMTLKCVDIVRIDHFRGFESYWEVPAGSENAVNGKWVPGPGMDLLKHFKGMNIIGEDLGVLTDEVKKLKKDSGFPGMKVLQFAWDFRDGFFNTKNEALPFNYEDSNCVAYTGTHDNATTKGWFYYLSYEAQDLVRRFFQCPDEDVVWQMIRSVLSSTANTAIIPMQDLLGLDESGRMNVPSTVGTSNWSWRYNPAMMKSWMIERFRDYIKLYGRDNN